MERNEKTSWGGGATGDGKEKREKYFITFSDVFFLFFTTSLTYFVQITKIFLNFYFLFSAFLSSAEFLGEFIVKIFTTWN